MIIVNYSDTGNVLWYFNPINTNHLQVNKHHTVQDSLASVVALGFRRLIATINMRGQKFKFVGICKLFCKVFFWDNSFYIYKFLTICGTSVMTYLEKCCFSHFKMFQSGLFSVFASASRDPCLSFWLIFLQCTEKKLYSLKLSQTCLVL